MSSTGLSKVREANPHDFFETPDWATRAILPHLPPLQRIREMGGTILDPCVGSGAITRVLREHYAAQEGPPPRIVGADIVERPGVDFVRDMLTSDPWPVKAALILTNPAYHIAEEIIRRSLLEREHSHGIVGMLLRVNFLGSQERIPLHRDHPADVHVLPRRPSFCVTVKCAAGKTPCEWVVALDPKADRPKACALCGGKVRVITHDSTEYAWFVWDPETKGRRWSILDCERPDAREAKPKAARAPRVRAEHPLSPTLEKALLDFYSATPKLAGLKALEALAKRGLLEPKDYPGGQRIFMPCEAGSAKALDIATIKTQAERLERAVASVSIEEVAPPPGVNPVAASDTVVGSDGL